MLVAHFKSSSWYLIWILYDSRAVGRSDCCRVLADIGDSGSKTHNPRLSVLYLVFISQAYVTTNLSLRSSSLFDNRIQLQMYIVEVFGSDKFL